jgi:hypothetical protein
VGAVLARVGCIGRVDGYMRASSLGHEVCRAGVIAVGDQDLPDAFLLELIEHLIARRDGIDA